MSDKPQVEVLDFLREQFARVHADLVGLRMEQREQRGRLVAIENALAGVRRDNADAYGHIVLLGQRLDAVNDRLDRIDRRLDLTDA